MEFNKQQEMQTIFNKVWHHFIIEGNPLSIGNEGPRYYGPNGSKCAVGILIPPDEYNENIEGKAIQKLRDDGLLPRTLDILIQEGMEDFLYDLSTWHDEKFEAINDLDGIEEYDTTPDKETLIRFAIERGLEVPR